MRFKLSSVKVAAILLNLQVQIMGVYGAHIISVAADHLELMVLDELLFKKHVLNTSELNVHPNL